MTKDDLGAEAKALGRAAEAAFAAGDYQHYDELMRRALWCRRQAREKQAGVKGARLACPAQ